MSTPIRMCIACKGRFKQNELIRLQYKDKKIQKFDGIGRSFYLCKACVFEKKSIEALIKICKLQKSEKENIKQQLKEIVINEQN